MQTNWLLDFPLTCGNEWEQFFGSVSESLRWIQTNEPPGCASSIKNVPYQVVLPRRQLADDSEILNFLLRYAGKFDMYVEDDYAAFVRYCFEDPLDAEIFRARFEPKAERFKLAG